VLHESGTYVAFTPAGAELFAWPASGAKIVAGCENHPDRPWQGPQACECVGAGMLCPRCNKVNDGEAPRMLPGFETE
jgi:galactose mutarotase-like enzyme